MAPSNFSVRQFTSKSNINIVSLNSCFEVKC